MVSLRAAQNGVQYSHVLANAVIGANTTSPGTLNMTTIPVPSTSRPVSDVLEKSTTTTDAVRPAVVVTKEWEKTQWESQQISGVTRTQWTV